MNKANLLFVIILGLLLSISIPMIAPNLGSGDFIAYWSSAHLLVSGGNPYDPSQMAELQKETQPDRFNDRSPLLNAWNPPWLLLILTPIGFLPFEIASHVWIFITTILLAITIRYTWKIINYNYVDRDYLISLFVGFTFGPTFSLLALGQISGIVLISYILCIYLLKNEKDFLAGVFLVFTLIKPHISYFFIAYILIFITFRKRWRFIWGLLSTILLSIGVIWILLPNWISSYASLLKSLPYSAVYTSTFGSLLFDITDINLFQFIGILLIPLFIFIAHRLSNNELLTAVNIGLLLSVPLSPFGFLFDQVILIPSLIQIYAWGIKDTQNILIKFILIVGYLVLNLITILLITKGNIPYYWFFWIPFAILILYLTAYKGRYGKIFQPS